VSRGSVRIRRAASALFVTTTACGSAVNTADGSSSDGLITLSMHNPGSKTQDPATWQMVQEFNKKHPDMKIKLEGQPVDQHEQRMTIAAQSGTLPEIFWVYDSLAKTMVKSGDLLDLSPILAENDLKAKFAPSMLAGFRSGNVQYGLPYQALITGFYYNKAILDECKIAVPETFDDLLAAVKKLKAAGVVPIAQGANNSSFSVWGPTRRPPITGVWRRPASSSSPAPAGSPPTSSARAAWKTSRSPTPTVPRHWSPTTPAARHAPSTWAGATATPPCLHGPAAHRAGQALRIC
jgi:ABC-type glycerol-3-phosphate transport system substrate-binding protein